MNPRGLRRHEGFLRGPLGSGGTSPRENDELNSTSRPTLSIGQNSPPKPTLPGFGMDLVQSPKALADADPRRGFGDSLRMLPRVDSMARSVSLTSESDKFNSSAMRKRSSLGGSTSGAGSYIAVDPMSGGRPNEWVEATWCIEDRSFRASASDEVRLLTSSGVVVSRVFLDTLTIVREDSSPNGNVYLHSGSCRIRCPPFPGGYLVSYVEAATGKRVLSAPFRVLGDTFSTPVDVRVNRDTVPPLTVMSATFDWASVLRTVNTHFGSVVERTRGVAVAVAEFDEPHNDGFTGSANGFTNASFVTVVPVPDSRAGQARIEFPSPSKPAMYTVRVLATPATGVPVAIALSPKFTVVDAPTEVPDGRALVEPTTRVCYVGEPVTVDFVLGGGEQHVKPRMLTALDHVRFFPVGRSEQDRFDGRLDRCTGRPASVAGSMRCTAPLVEGCFDVAFRRFLDNETIALGSTLTTKLPDAVIEITPNPDPLNNSTRVVRVTCSVPDFITASDRVQAYDETANMVQSAVVEILDEHTAEASLYIGVSGKCNVKYLSARVGYEMPWRASELITTSATAVPAVPTAHLLVLHTVSLASPSINVLFEKQDSLDPRAEEVQRRDVLALFEKDVAESACTAWADDPDAMPAVQVVYLRGRLETDVRFTTEGLHAGTYTLRYMVCLPHRPGSREAGGWLLIASTECDVLVVDPNSTENRSRAARIAAVDRGARLASPPPQGSNGNAGGADEELAADPAQLEQASAAELAVVRHRHKTRAFSQVNRAHLGMSAHLGLSRADASQRASPRGARRASRKASFSSMSRLHVVRRLSTVTMQPKASLLGTRRSSSAYASVSRRSREGPIGIAKDDTVPVKLNALGFDGALLAPRVGSTEDPVLITLHLTAGLPRPDDLIVLLNDDCTRVLAELPINLCESPTGQLTFCSAVLNPPRFSGKYLAGFYSQKAQAVVLLSERVRVRVAPTSSKDASATSPKLSAPRNRSRVAAPESPSHGTLMSPTNAGRGTPTSTRQTVASRQTHVALTPKASSGKAWDLAAGRFRDQGFGGKHHPAVRLHSLTRPVGALPRTRALIIGCAYFKQPHELGGPSNDVIAMENVLTRYVGITTDNLIVLSEGSLHGPDFHPTAANIRRTIRWLTHEARGNDHLILYFSGSGARVPPAAQALDPDPEYDNALLPTDHDYGHRAITYKELAATLFTPAPATAAVSVFVDACFTSTALDAYEYRAGGDSSATVLPTGVTNLRRLRATQGEPERARWRCVLPQLPAPMAVPGRSTRRWSAFEPVTARHGLRKLLSVPTTQHEHYDEPATPLLSGSPAASFRDSGYHRRLTLTHSMRKALGTDDIPDNGRFSLLEATREGADRAYGAWDLFLREEGCTMGLFTFALGQVICQSALEHGPDGKVAVDLCWHELEGRVKRMVRGYSGGAHQLPQGSHGHRSQLDRPVFPLGIAETE